MDGRRQRAAGRAHDIAVARQLRRRGRLAPEYPGSKDYELVGLPMVDIEWRDTVFLSTQRGFGAYFRTTRQFRAGARLTL